MSFKEMSKDQAYFCAVTAFLILAALMTITLRWTLDVGWNAVGEIIAAEVCLWGIAVVKYREWYAWMSVALLVLVFISGCGITITRPLH